jgi:uncharacterized protein YjbI with pentapeptide repeats
LRLHWLGMLLLGLLALMLLTLSPVLGQEPPKPETQKPWTGKLADGRVITQADLDRILQAHALYLKSEGKEGQWADLRYANLSGAQMGGANLRGAYLLGANLSGALLAWANLTGADLREATLSRTKLGYANLSRASLIVANLSEADLWEANLSGAFLDKADLRKAGLLSANLSKARLDGADLSGARLSGADTRVYRGKLSGAHLSGADLSGASLIDANLSKTYLSGANLSGADFELDPPGTVSDATFLLNIRGLASLQYKYSPHSLVELRETYKKAGMREPERELTYALNHNRRVKLWEKSGLLNKLESLFNLVCFEWTCQYGMNPGRPLGILGLGLFLFAPFYLLALRSWDPETGIWLVLPPDRIIGEGSKVRPFKLTRHTPFRPLPPERWPRLNARLHRGLRRVRLAFYFSLLSAFNLGWRELNVGNWISRLQKREYTLRATGWPRTVAGFQSLLSVYLLALWVLTYFGRPFD